MNPRSLNRHLRYACLALAGIGVAYLFVRYSRFELPEEGCSPLLRFSPGEALLVDHRPPLLSPGDAVFFRAPDGQLYLGLIARTRESASADLELWLETDAPDCPGTDSDDLGWIAASEVNARVMLAWPW